MPHESPLSGPFSCLPDNVQKRVLGRLSFSTLTPGSSVYIQEVSRIQALWIIISGRVRYYFKDIGTKVLDGTLSSEELFGGLSLIYNDQTAIHTLTVVEETRIMSLDAVFFTELCREAPCILDHFALEMGRCMRNPRFADIIARRVKGQNLTLPFFNQPVSAIFRPSIVTCDSTASVSDAAQKMDRQKSSAILVKDEDQVLRSIVTDADLKSRVLAQGLSPDTRVTQISSTPLATISSQAQVFDAFITMIREDKRHLVVTGNAGTISGIISEKDLIEAQTRTTYLLIQSVRSAKTMDGLTDIHHRMEKMLLDPISNGARSDHITRLISAFSDAIIDRAIEFSMKEVGPAPCAFSFLTMGSEGREEQTLISDQDNAIVFEDMAAAPQSAKAYFDRLAQAVCQKLDLAGFRYCDGNNMAQNPKWCQPLSVWKGYFNTWIRSASPEDLLHASIFFDFRGTWGAVDLPHALKTFLFEAIGKWSGFLRNMAENTLHFKPPIGLFGKFVVETQGKHKNALDIKYALLPIIDFARIYALQNSISATNTLDRLFRLYTRHALTVKEYKDLLQAYHFLMELRFRRQITAIMDEKENPDNYIYPANLSTLDQIMLKETLKMVEKLHQKLAIEFMGVA